MGRSRSIRRLNVKALIGTVIVVLVLVGGGLLAAGAFQDRVRDQVFSQTDELIEKNKYGMAMRHLERYLSKNPEDVEVLDRYARLLSEAVFERRDGGRLDAAISINERLLRLDPEGTIAEDPQQNRRWLATLYILRTEAVAAGNARFNFREADQGAALESRYQAAEKVTRDLIDRDPENADAEAHRLLAIALQGTAGQDRGKLEEAETEYEKALDRDPTDVEAAARLARLRRDGLETPSKADTVLDRLIKAAPDDPRARLAVYSHYNGTSEQARASEALAKAVELAPEDLAVVREATDDALRRDDLQAARALLRRLPEELRALPEIELRQATIDFRERQTDSAIARLRESLRNVGGASDQLVFTLASALIDSGNLQDAAPLVERYKSLTSSEGNYWYLLGTLQQKAGDLTKAVESFEKANFGIDPQYKATMLIARGRSKLRLSSDRKARSVALQDLRGAIDANRQSPQAWLALVDALARGGDVDEALEELRKGIATMPESPEMRRALLQFLLAIEQAKPRPNQRSWRVFDNALRDAREIESLKEDPTLAALEAQRLRLSGRDEDARALIEQAVEEQPGSSVLWSSLVDALLREGLREDALAALERASAPEAVGDSGTYRVLRAQLLTQLGRGGEAIDLLIEGTRALTSDQKPAVLRLLGQMQAARGQLSEARATYEQWRDLQPGSTVPILALLQLALDTGNASQAEDALETLGKSSGKTSLSYILGSAEYLLRMPGGDSTDRASRALELLDPILEDGKPTENLAAARLLRGLAYRELARAEDDETQAEDRLEAARDDLEIAWADGKGERRALSPMIDVLVQLDDFSQINELDLLSAGGIDPEIDKLTTVACLRHGKLDRAAEYLDMATQAAPANDPQFTAWRTAVLDRLGRTNQVEQVLQQQAQNRGDASSWITLIRYQAARGRSEQAEQSIAEMKRVVRVDPPELLEARIREALGDRDAAESAYEAAVQQRPESLAVLLTASRFDQTSGNADRALELVEQALAVDPSSRDASRLKALLLAERARDLPSWQRAWEALGPEPDPEAGNTQAPRDRLARAILLARHPELSRRREAVNRLESLVGDQPSGDPLAAAARDTLAKLLLQQDDPSRAAEIAAVTALSGTNPSAIALYARALLAADQVDEASRQIDRLKNLSPDPATLTELELRLVEARAEAGSRAEELESAYFAAVDQDEAETGTESGSESESESESKSDPTAKAVAIFRRLVQLGDPAAEVAGRVGVDLAGRFPRLAWLPSQWFASRDAYPDALDLAETAIDTGENGPTFQGARSVLTVVERSGADPSSLDRAAELIERAATEVDLPANRAILAMLRHFQGRTDPARFQDEIRIYRELLEQDPDNIIYLNNLAWALGECSDQPEEALELIDQAFESLSNRLPELLDTRGVILDRLGRHDEAITSIEEALQTQPNRAIYHFHLARALDADGRTDDARSSISRALELGLTAEDVEPTERKDFDRLKDL